MDSSQYYQRRGPPAEQFYEVRLPQDHYHAPRSEPPRDQRLASPSFVPPPVDYQRTAPYPSAQPQQPDHAAYPPLAQHSPGAESTETLTEKEKWQDRKHATAFGDWTWRGLFALKYLKYWVILLVVVAFVVVVTIEHHQIVNWLRPKAEQLQDLPAGWLIPVRAELIDSDADKVGILFIISFPPLFGHEIVAVLLGLIYGLWIGFAICCAGTLLGELGNWFLFRYALRNKAKARETTDVTYASMARVIHDGGFKVVLYARLSAIPGHLTTPLFAVSDMSLFVFTVRL